MVIMTYWTASLMAPCHKVWTLGSIRLDKLLYVWIYAELVWATALTVQNKTAGHIACCANSLLAIIF